MKLENYEVHLPNYSIGDKIYDKIGPVCESYGKKVLIIGGRRALNAAEDKIRAYVAKTNLEIIGTKIYGTDCTYATVEKLRELPEYEARNLDKAEVVFVAYGSTARVVLEAMEILQKEGIETGLIRPKTLWPFPDQAFENLGDNVKKVISVELSQGQMINDVKLALNGRYHVDLINRVGGMLLSPAEIAERTKTLMGGTK